MTTGILNKRLDARTLPALMCIAAFVRPEYLVQIGVLGQSYLYFRVCVMTAVVLAALLGRRWDRFFILWGIFGLWACLATLVNHAEIQQAVEQAAVMTSLAGLFCLYRHQLRWFLRLLWLYLCALVVVNLLTMLVSPSGLYSTATTSLNWFLGFKNAHFAYLLPTLVLTLVFSRLEGISFWKASIVIIVVISAVLARSATALVGLGLVLALCAVPFVRKRVNVFNAYTYTAATIAAFYGVVVLRMQHVFAFMIVDLLGKSLDLSNRTTLWDVVMGEVARRPLIGHGHQSPEFMRLLFLDSSIISAHNQILDYLYTGGAVALILYACINLSIVRRLFSTRRSPMAQVAAAAWFGLQVALLSEAYTQAAAYMVYFIAYYAVELDAGQMALGIAPEPHPLTRSG